MKILKRMITTHCSMIREYCLIVLYRIGFQTQRVKLMLLGLISYTPPTEVSQNLLQMIARDFMSRGRLEMQYKNLYPYYNTRTQTWVNLVRGTIQLLIASAIFSKETVDGIAPKKAVVLAKPEIVQLAHDLGMSVTIWTCKEGQTGRFPNVKEEMRHLLQAGVDAIFTDNPDQFPVK